jgi:hypothetical protein
MSNRSPEVDKFLSELSHPFKDDVLAVRAAILDSEPEITEHIKWKAPSFCIDGEDRVTFRLQGDRLQLIFHRGAKVRDDEFSFEDDTGLMEWASGDRAVVSLDEPGDVPAKLPAVVGLVGRWMQATR